MLGIIMGVASLIMMVSVGAGAQARVSEQIQSLGTNLLIVISNSNNIRGVRGGGGTRATLTEDDAYAIQREITAVQAAAPTLGATLQIVNSNLNWGVTVTGITPEWLEVKEWNLADGRPLTAEDHRTAAKVALLGQTAAGRIFGDDNPIGTVIRIKRVPFTVVGVLEAKGQDTSGRDQDDIVMVPLSTGRRKLFGRVPEAAEPVGRRRCRGVREGDLPGEGRRQAAAPAPPPAAGDQDFTVRIPKLRRSRAARPRG